MGAIFKFVLTESGREGCDNAAEICEMNSSAPLFFGQLCSAAKVLASVDYFFNYVTKIPHELDGVHNMCTRDTLPPPVPLTAAVRLPWQDVCRYVKTEDAVSLFSPPPSTYGDKTVEQVLRHFLFRASVPGFTVIHVAD